MPEGLAAARLELARLVVQSPNKDDPNRELLIVNQRVSDLKRIIAEYPRLLREDRKILNRIDDGMLPLHHAVENQAPLAVIDLVAEAFKPAIFQEYTPPKGLSRTVLDKVMNFVSSSEIYGCLLRHSMSFLCHSQTTTGTAGWNKIQSFFEDHGYRNERAMRALLKTFPDFAKRKLPDKTLPLHYALSSDAPEEVVAMLVEANHEAITTVSSSRNTTPLHMLVEGSSMSMDLLELLVSPEVVKMRDAHDNLPIHSYCKRSFESETFDDDILGYLVEAYPESIMQRDNCERTPLLCHLSCNASAERNLWGIQYLVECNPESIKLVDNDGMNALHYACRERCSLSSTVIHFLYETYPENLVALDSSGRSPLHYLCDEADDDDLPLFELLHDATPQSFSLLSKDGLSPLHIACRSADLNSAGLVRFLAEVCPLALRVIAKGATPFHMACVRQNVQVQVIHFLAQECPDLLEGNMEICPFHETPLNVLCRNEHIEDDDLLICLRALAISKGAVETLDRDGSSTLHALCKNRAPPKCLQVVLDKSSDLLYSRNDNAQTVLHVAVESCASGQESNGIVELLLDKYPLGIQDRDTDSKTPLVVACEKDVSVGVIYQLFHVDPISSLDMLRNAAVPIPTTSTGKRKRDS